MSISADFVAATNERVRIASTVFPATSEREAFGTLDVEGEHGKITFFVHGASFLRKLSDEALKLEEKMIEQDRINEAIANIKAGKLAAAS
jgi:hypothetical protein